MTRYRLDIVPIYLCVGGYVWSLYDGEKHWVSCYKLPSLYGVDPLLCKFALDENSDKLIGVDLSKYVILRPDGSGQYDLITELTRSL